MPFALITLVWVSNAFLILTVLSGLKVWGATQFMTNHMTSALTTVMLLLFTHSMIMFYFIGTGKKVKEVISDWGEKRESYWGKVIFVKRKLFPPMTYVCLLIVLMFLMGGALSAGLVSKKIHQGVVYFTLVYNLYVSVLEGLYIYKNLIFMQDVAHQAALAK